MCLNKGAISPDYSYDSPSMKIFHDKSAEKKCIDKKWIAAGAIALTILAAGGLTLAYFFSPSVHTFMNNTFAHIQNGNMSVGQGLLFIGLPIAGGAVLIGLAVHLYKRHQEKKENTFSFVPSVSSKTGEGWKASLPSKKKVLIGVAVVASLAALAVIGFLVIHYVPAANQWVTHKAIPFISQGLSHQMKIWQGLAIIGGGTAGIALLTGLAIALAKRCQALKQQRKYEKSTAFDPTWD